MLISPKCLPAIIAEDACGRRSGVSTIELESGFTLIEMMIAIVILSLMLALAMPSYAIWIQNTRIRSATESFLSGLQLARNEAVRRNSDVQFVVGTDSAWTVSCRVVTPGCLAADVVAIQSRPVKEGSTSAVTVAASDGKTIRFDSFGRMSFPVPAGANVRFNFDNNQLSAIDSRDLRVTIDTAGNVRMCDPNVVAPDVRRC
jgi:type IV fimbrial biogenesis protein FimT